LRFLNARPDERILYSRSAKESSMIGNSGFLAETETDDVLVQESWRRKRAIRIQGSYGSKQPTPPPSQKLVPESDGHGINEFIGIFC